VRGDPALPAVIVQLLGEGFGFVQALEGFPELSEQHEDIAPVKLQVDGLLTC
jgi:hypothetical protein